MIGRSQTKVQDLGLTGWALPKNIVLVPTAGLQNVMVVADVVRAVGPCVLERDIFRDWCAHPVFCGLYTLFKSVLRVLCVMTTASAVVVRLC